MKFLFVFVILAFPKEHSFNQFIDDKILSESQVDRLCLELNKMKNSDKSNNEMENFLRKTIGKQIRKQSFPPKMQGAYDEQGLNLKDQDIVGEYGQLVEVREIGTGSSTSQYFPGTVTMEGNNNNFDSTEISDLLVTTNMFNSLPVRSDEKNNGRERNRMMYPKLMQNRKTAQLSLKECLSIIQNVYQNEKNEMEEVLNEKNISTQTGKEVDQLREEYQGYIGNSNSTSIDTDISIAPNGYAFILNHVARGQATKSDIATLIERQSHDDVKGSKSSVINVVLAPEVIQ